jgi:BON domain-containing protein
MTWKSAHNHLSRRHLAISLFTGRRFAQLYLCVMQWIRTGGRTMREKRGLRSISLIVTLALAGLASMAMFAGGCNTVQSPNRQASDVQITTQVKAKLASDVRPSSLTNIDVNTTNGVVTLAGQVENAEVKHRAETVAASVPGVVRINNNLQVDPASASIAH